MYFSGIPPTSCLTKTPYAVLKWRLKNSIVPIRRKNSNPRVTQRRIAMYPTSWGTQVLYNALYVHCTRIRQPSSSGIVKSSSTSRARVFVSAGSPMWTENTMVFVTRIMDARNRATAATFFFSSRRYSTAAATTASPSHRSSPPRARSRLHVEDSKNNEI